MQRRVMPRPVGSVSTPRRAHGELARRPRLDMNQLRNAYRSGRPAVVLLRIPSEIPPRLRAQLEVVAACEHCPGLHEQSLLGRALARRTVGMCCDTPLSSIRLESTPRGQPQILVNGDRHDSPGLSIAHSDTTVGVAVCAQGRIGIDLERVRPVSAAVVARVFAPEDATYLRALGDSQREHAFARLWTVAEACAKATGTGLEMLLNGLQRLGPDRDGVYDGCLRWAVGMPYSREACAIACDPLCPVVSCIGRAPEMTLDELLYDGS